MFKALGVLVLAYSVYAAANGQIYAKARWRGRLVSRAETNGYFWAVVACYACLGVALLTVF
jgi:hypothetical protein